MQNNQDGTFTKVNTPVDDELAAHTIGTWTDFDLDGYLDLAIGSGEVSFLSRDHLYVNQLAETGEPNLVKLTEGNLATQTRDGQNWNFIDYDLDGDLDAFITNYNSGRANDLYKNENGEYLQQTEAEAGSIANQSGAGLNNIWADFDNDGYQDCIVIFDGQVDRYYHNNGDGTFTEVANQPFTLAANSRGASAGDFDNDGFMDLMISATTATAVGLYQNEGNLNHWFHLHLKGQGPNTAALGAQVRLKANLNGESKWQHREVNAQNTFNGHNSLRLHFGLADATMIDSIEVIWPDGLRQIATEIAADQICNWEQGATNACGTTVGQSHLDESPNQLNIFPNPIKEGQLHFTYEFAKAQGTAQVELV